MKLPWCECADKKPEQMPELPQCLQCATCSGVISWRIYTMEELEIARRLFGVKS